MSRTRLFLAATVAALVAAAPIAAQSAAAPKLAGTVGPGFTITLKQGRTKVRKLKAGKYTLVVSDKSSIHDYRIKGPGLNKVVTGVGFVGTKTVTITLKPGKYTYICDPHPLTMRGSFTVS